ncbi:MAG: menaquinone biosynthesis protein [Trichlorobacter sp.]|jgi:chorismate dehydratase
MLKVGWIDYANCRPLLLQIENRLPGTGISLDHGVPAQLNAALAAGEIDLCISSSIEFARHADQYCVLPGHCIGSDGPVQSVLLLTNRPVQELGAERLLVTSESATSVVLLEILLTRHWGLSGCSIESSRLPWREALTLAPGVLLIGDAALRAAMEGDAPYCYDLGAAWKEMTGLPFVFALWQVTQSAVAREPENLHALLALLDQARDQMPGRLEQLAAVAPETQWMGAGLLAEYWRHITYRLDERHLAGLNRFYTLATELGLIKAAAQPLFLKV